MPIFQTQFIQPDPARAGRVAQFAKGTVHAATYFGVWGVPTGAAFVTARLAQTCPAAHVMESPCAAAGEDATMIMRIFQVVTRPGKEREFGEFFYSTAIPLMQNTRGIVTVLPGAARSDSPREFSFVMVWESLEALKAFAGEDYASPHIAPAEAELVESRSIRHYDLVEV